MNRYSTCVIPVFNGDMKAIHDYLLNLAKTKWPGRGMRWVIGMESSNVSHTKPMLNTWVKLIRDNPTVPVHIVVTDETTGEVAFALMNSKVGRNKFRFRCASKKGCGIDIPTEALQPKPVIALMKNDGYIVKDTFYPTSAMQ